jgi:L-rhamnose mutarotase
MNTRHCLALDLKNDLEAIAAYDRYHQAVWPEVLQSIKASGIINMEIYRFQNRLFMIMDVDDTFSFEAKAAADESNEKVQEWERLMGQFQQVLPGTDPDDKWRWKKMDRVFSLH